MTIERQYKLVFFVCDDCGETSVPDEDFDVMKSDATSDGWKIIKDEDTDEWVHLCPACAKDLSSIRIK